MRRLGVASADTDDATQRVFMIAARRVADIAVGSERTSCSAPRCGSHPRLSAPRAELQLPLDDERTNAATARPVPEELDGAEPRARRARRALTAMPLELRTVLVLFELEQMTKTEVAELLELPVGTAVSRLRRAREEFRSQLKRRNARLGRRHGSMSPT